MRPVWLQDDKTVVLDSVRLRDFAMCEQMFAYRHVECLAPKGPKPASLSVGGWWASVMEELYSFPSKYPTIEDAIRMAAFVWQTLDLDRREALGEVPRLAELIGMLTDFWPQYSQDRQVWRVIAVEAPFEVPLGTSPKHGLCVKWIGRADRHIFDGQRVQPVDDKTVSTITGDTPLAFQPSFQLAGYVYVTRQLAQELRLGDPPDRCIVNIFAKRPSKNRPRFLRIFPSFTDAQLEEFRLQVLTIADRLWEAYSQGEWMWNTMACSNIYYRPCDYRQICSVTSAARPIVISASYAKVEPWTPSATAAEESSDDT
jgi:hypothetical protein